MKDIITNRIKRLEEILRQENPISMVAISDEEGFHWNDRTYADRKELSAAVQLIAYDIDKPLVIISKIR